MPLIEALADLMTNHSVLWVVTNNEGEVWRKTEAGTPLVILRWGFRRFGAYVDCNNLRWELHVHGKVMGKLPSWDNAEPALCGSNLKGGKYILKRDEWDKVKGTVKALVE
jgi:hypothetical protein